ncbi:DUF4097 family beta strand repeat-containing protein [Streptomyces sp. NPDC050560]|uniref:DUF4097 family beta strand repeat-containing protein n=1 Tax=Streptomyces sp. NPDC050560 TaxID=3365630 RepID=UPI00378C3934
MATPHRTTRILLLGGGAFLALSFAALVASGGSVDDEGPEKRSFRPPGERLTIAKGDGDIDIRPADIDEIEVTRRFSGWATLGSPEAHWELRDHTLTLATDCGPVGRCEAHYEVRVPEDIALTVEGDSGKITASGFGTPLHIRSDNGAISANDISGRLTLATDSGELRGTGITSRRVQADSQNGDVHLSFARVPDQVRTETENGAVEVEVPDTDAVYKVRTATDSGDVHTGIPKDANSPHALTVRSESGAITLRTAGK